MYQVILCDLFGMVKWPFQGISDLQLGDKKATLNHLVWIYCQNLPGLPISHMEIAIGFVFRDSLWQVQLSSGLYTASSFLEKQHFWDALHYRCTITSRPPQTKKYLS